MRLKINKKKQPSELELIKKRVDEINKIKSDLNKELEELRYKCQHTSKKVGYLMLPNGTYDISEICVDCGKILGPVTEFNMRDI